MLEISSLTIEELIEYITSIGEKPFRAKQIFNWLQKGISDFNDMKNLNSTLIDRLKKDCFLTVCRPKKIQISADGTRKYLFELYDGEFIESVFMKYRHGNTLCISTQVGCRMGCSFCASTANGKIRDLFPSEMLLQVIEAQKNTGERISNIVLMGIGEPLDNYNNVIKFLKAVNNKDGLNIGYRHISLSTCGLVNMFDKLESEKMPINLSVSLHAPNDDIRQSIMPIARKYTIDELIQASKKYSEKSGRRVHFEYTLINNVNDQVKHAEELGKRLSGMLCHVNLIPLNTTEKNNYKRSEKNIIKDFTKTLEKYKIDVTVRRSLGTDISAACGQLRAEAN
ncbi:23S rRNA (adenine(2503)-C(2))-methyltransferase RlmN [Eubacteriales bacterium OttesenSCG-928-G02]|nr:23S rRNA (adenine(2503)-C(2))-methyltransferase RlmN [Eubacteriales bacterium OttesenSCG-928-G02]